MRSLAGCVAIALLLAPTSHAGKKNARAPFDLGVRFLFEESAGEEGLREELELQMLTELRRAGCFRTVDLALPAAAGDSAAADELRLEVTVRELFDETTYDTSIAQRADPNASHELETAFTTRIRLLVHAALVHPAGERELRSRQIRASGAHRPLTIEEDARLTARTQAMVELVRAIRLFVCKGGEKRLAKEIAR
jgi:hypothetical protein